MNMETTRWWKDSCRHFLSLAMTYKLQLSPQNNSENSQSADPDFLWTDRSISTDKYHLFYKIIPTKKMQEKIKINILGRMMQKQNKAQTKYTNSIFTFWFLTNTKHCPTLSHCDTKHKTEKFIPPTIPGQSFNSTSRAVLQHKGGVVNCT